MDLSKVLDVPSALEIFDRHRGLIEAAASAKFDAGGPDDDDTHEGKPVITLRSVDIPTGAGIP
jgi:hypothetical protein